MKGLGSLGRLGAAGRILHVVAGRFGGRDTALPLDDLGWNVGWREGNRLGCRDLHCNVLREGFVTAYDVACRQGADRGSLDTWLAGGPGRP